MSPHDQAVYFNALPLLIVAASYLFVAALLGRALWRHRERVTTADLALASIFPAVGIAAAILGIVVLEDGEPVGGHIWPPFVACVIALIPALAFLFRGQERANVVLTTARARFAASNARADAMELAAWTQVTRVLINLDEFITQDELRALSEQYKRIAGFSIADVAPPR